MKEFTNLENAVSLEEVLESAKKIAEELSARQESKMDQFERIIKGVARKYASIYVDREDLEQELWLTTLKLIESKGGEEFTDARLVAKSCYNRAVDFYRYERRRRDSTRKMLEDYEMYDEESGEAADSSFLSAFSCFDSGYDIVVIKEVIDLFPLESKERKYIVTKLYMYGEIDETTGLPDKLERPEGDTEADVLHMLGYTGKTASSSWMKIKNKMKETIYAHLGILKDTKNMSKEEEDAAIMTRVEEIFKNSASYYIYSSKLLKDTVLRAMNCDEQRLLQIMKNSTKLVIGMGWSSCKTYLMRNEEKYIKIAQEEGDTLYLENK